MSDRSSCEPAELKEMIASWFDLAEGRLWSCLDMELARRRAGDLRRLILKRSISPRSLRLTDDLKNVLYALVELVKTSGSSKAPSEPAANEAQHVYDFIREIHWPDDVFSEKEELLEDCVRAGAKRDVRRLLDLDAGPGGPARPDGSHTERGAPEEQARQVFDLNRDWIRGILLEECHTEVDVADLEQELFAWFSRFWRRSSTGPSNPKAVLFGACPRFANAYRGAASTSTGEGMPGKLIRMQKRQSRPPRKSE